LLVIVDVLERFKTNRDIKKRFPGDGHIHDRSGFKFQIGSDVFVSGVLDARLIDVNTDDAFRRFGQKIAAVSFTGSEVEYSLIANKLSYEGVTVQVFVADLGAFKPGHISLACPFEHR